MLRATGFGPYVPRGAYYVMCDITDFGIQSDVEFTRQMIERNGIAVVPGSSFYSHAGLGAQQVRFAFPKKMETLQAVAERLAVLPAPRASSAV